MEILPLCPSHTLPDGRVSLLGAVDTVTGAMTRIEAGGAALLVDCGIAQGDEADHWQFPDAARDVDAVLLTHGHNDHVGSLPVLLDGGFSRPIYGTRATLDIADLVLEDGIRLQGGSEQDAGRFRRRFRELCRPVAYDAATTLEGFAGTFTFHEAGHILGSASVELETRASRIIISGDLGRPDSPILRDYETRWKAERAVDLVVMESTYGDCEHRASHDDVERDLERIVTRAAHAGGHILVPAFAIGRTQTLLYHLNTLVEARRIPPIVVAVDTPLGLRITELYQKAHALFDAEALAKIARGDDPLDFENLFAVKKSGDSVRLRDVREPMLVIAGSGMCTGGRVVGHLRELLPLERTTVLFVGYQAAGTPGRAIQQAKSTSARVRLDGEDVPVRARIETLSGLSAHADRVELLRWLRAIPGLRRAGLHHGEPSAQRAFVAWAAEQAD
jgi:metallo-beta-lactamase family protein